MHTGTIPIPDTTTTGKWPDPGDGLVNVDVCLERIHCGSCLDTGGIDKAKFRKHPPTVLMENGLTTEEWEHWMNVEFQKARSVRTNTWIEILLVLFTGCIYVCLQRDIANHRAVCDALLDWQQRFNSECLIPRHGMRVKLRSCKFEHTDDDRQPPTYSVHHTLTFAYAPTACERLRMENPVSGELNPYGGCGGCCGCPAPNLGLEKGIIIV